MTATGEHPAGETLAAARVRWDGEQCLSAEHGDRYFSPDAINEVERVFMAPVKLSQRLAALPKDQTSTFTCAETGFGTGLNAAVVFDHFLARAPKKARLHFVSFERAPLAASDMQGMARKFRGRLPIFAELAKAYPPRLSGWHRLHLADNARITLSLYFGDAEEGLADIAQRQRLPVDHWLLDGFAPQKNPSLWQQSLFDKIAALSAPDTTLATYTAVGNIRRGLQNLGFAMRKVDQMPIKLHSLAGIFTSTPAAGVQSAKFSPPKRVQVFGAGIAGTSLARSLAERGIAVTLVEPLGKVASGASRIPAAVLHGRLRDDGSPDAAWQAMSYHYSHRRLENYRGFNATGARQISGANSSPERLAALLARYGESGDWIESVATPASRWRKSDSALRFNIGGVVHGPTLCSALADHPLITLTTDADSVVSDSHARPVVVLTNGYASRESPAAGYLEIAALAGQAELCAHPAPPTDAIVGAGYMAPCRGGMVIGSTYEYRPWQPAEAVEANLAPWLDTGRHRGSFRGHRTITSDRVCIVGRLYDRDHAPVANLRIATGFGSTGMSSAPLAGECIAAELAGEFAPVTQTLQRTVSSLRFRLRQDRRGPRMGAQP